MNPLFPNRTNVQFMRVLNRGNLQIEIWERGAGTLWLLEAASTAVSSRGIQAETLRSGCYRSYAGRASPDLIQGRILRHDERPQSYESAPGNIDEAGIEKDLRIIIRGT